MDTILLPPDFKDLLKCLNSSGVEYLLVGGYAVGYHGYPRATGDLDIWVARSGANAEKVAAALRAFGFGSDEVTPEVFTEENRVVRMGIPPVRVEFLTTVSGVGFDACWAVRELAVLDGISVNMIDASSLKVNKKVSEAPAMNGRANRPGGREALLGLRTRHRARCLTTAPS